MRTENILLCKLQCVTGPAQQVFEWGGAKDERVRQIGVGGGMHENFDSALNYGKCVKQTKLLFPNVQCCCNRIFKFTITQKSNDFA